MRRLGQITGWILTLTLVLTFPAQAQEARLVVRGYLFYSPTCPACHQTRTMVLPQLYRKYGQQLQIKAIDINANDGNYQWLVACEKEYQVPEDEVAIPALFIGDQYLIGTPDIQDQLPSLIEHHLEQGGVDYPDVPRPGAPLEPAVRFMFFYSPTCPHCRDVEENVFPAIQQKHGEQVRWEAYDISQEANYLALLNLGKLAGLPDGGGLGAVPVVFMGDEYSLYSLMLGSADIRARLGQAIDWSIGIGGVGLPEWAEQLFTPPTPPSSPEPSVPAEPTATEEAPPATVPVTPPGNSPAIHMAYFAETGCSECDRVSIALEHLQDRYPDLEIHEFNIIDDVSINLCLSEKLDVPEAQRHDAPAVFVGTDYLVDTDIQYDKLIEIVSRYADDGVGPTWEGCREAEVELPPPPPWWAVILPGLADGINPCAFATLVFFVSYLSFLERKGREILVAGAAFTLAVFLSYLAFGMVLREILAGLIARVGPILRVVLNGVTVVLCLVLAVFSFADFRKARQGKVKDMTLRLPDKLRGWINRSIRQGMRAEAFVAASFVTGVVVSFIELACTGQVYVPIILGLSRPGYRGQALLALVVYCLAFIVPLIVVFAVSYMGTSSRKLGGLIQRYTASVKLITAVLFVGISLWLVYDIVRDLGVVGPLITRASG